MHDSAAAQVRAELVGATVISVTRPRAYIVARRDSFNAHTVVIDVLAAAIAGNDERGCGNGEHDDENPRRTRRLRGAGSAPYRQQDQQQRCEHRPFRVQSDGLMHFRADIQIKHRGESRGQRKNCQERAQAKIPGSNNCQICGERIAAQ
jgi:hypothetical protein